MSVKVLSALLSRDRAIVLGGLLTVAASAWLYLFLGAGMPMETMDMSGRIMAMPAAWTLGYAAVIFVMWAVMMVAMMLPAAAPVILLAAALDRQRCARAPAQSALFATGYLLVWAGFSLVATSLQWGLDMAGLLSPAMTAANRLLAGGVLLAAGLYQWTPLKNACLSHCRSPIAFLMQHWRQGSLGAVFTGIRHGAFCLGCCWMLMGLLFVGGLMNLAWIAAIALLVLIEKTVSWGGRMARVTGAALAAWGVATLAM